MADLIHEDGNMPFILFLLLSGTSLPAATFVVNMTTHLPPSYNLSYFGSLILEDPPLLTSASDYHQYAFNSVNLTSPLFTPLPSYQVTLEYLDSANFYDGFQLRILGPFRETTILCGNGFESFGLECGPLVYRRHEYNSITGMWESELDLMRTLQNTPTMRFLTNEVSPFVFAPAHITVQEIPEPATWMFFAPVLVVFKMKKAEQ